MLCLRLFTLKTIDCWRFPDTNFFFDVLKLCCLSCLPLRVEVWRFYPIIETWTLGVNQLVSYVVLLIFHHHLRSLSRPNSPILRLYSRGLALIFWWDKPRKRLSMVLRRVCGRVSWLRVVLRLRRILLRLLRVLPVLIWKLFLLDVLILIVLLLLVIMLVLTHILVLVLSLRVLMLQRRRLLMMLRMHFIIGKLPTLVSFRVSVSFRGAFLENLLIIRGLVWLLVDYIGVLMPHLHRWHHWHPGILGTHQGWLVYQMSILFMF